jgi:hypothetical protein
MQYIKKELRRNKNIPEHKKTEADLNGWMIGRLELLKKYTYRWEEGYED